MFNFRLIKLNNWLLISLFFHLFNGIKILGFRNSKSSKIKKFNFEAFLNFIALNNENGKKFGSVGK